MNRARRLFAPVLLAVGLAALLVACGGSSLLVSLDDAGDSGACHEILCASNRGWNPASCMCELLDVGRPPIGLDATTSCPPIACPAGSVQGTTRGECACLPIEVGVIDDATPPTDAPIDASLADAPQDSARDGSDAPYDGTQYDGTQYDATQYDATQYDATQYDAAFYDSSYYFDAYSCGPSACGPGYEATTSCQCIACTNVCPAGQTPAAGCGGCSPCGYQCPAGFRYAGGSGCACIPPGVDSGTVAGEAGPGGGDAGGVTCLLEGYNSCSAGSWCQLGICPDGTTQYGCYCNPDGTATCSLTCPLPPPCTIPGQGTCPYGAQCVFGSCAADASSTALVCSCNSGGTAYCYTSSCNGLDGGISTGTDAGDGGDGGVTCLLEGYYGCSAGSWCELGLCPDGTTQYGCTCNADGTATCRLTCPLPAPCTIPGEGTCPYGTSCVFGTCDADGGTQLSCYCSSGGSASCFTMPCGAADGGGGRDL